MHHRRLPIASPCHERFAAMEDRGDRRFCDRCRKSVHDLSSMTRAEARHFLLRHRGQRVCVRYEVRPDQTLRFRPPPARAAGPVVVMMVGLMAACTGYVEAAELSSPEDGLTCEDAAGYTIPCMPEDELGGEEIEPTLAPEPTVEPVEPIEPEDEPEGWTLDDLVQAPPPEDGPGCTLRRWDDGIEDYGGELMGELEAPRFSRRQERRIEREYRREQRRARRRARQAAP